MSVSPDGKPKAAAAASPAPAKAKPGATPKSDTSQKKGEQPESHSPDEGEEDLESGSSSFFRNISSFLVSLVFHVLLLLALALWQVHNISDDSMIALAAAPEQEEVFEDEVFELEEEIELEEPEELQEFTPESLDPMGMTDFGGSISDELVDASMESVSSYDVTGSLFGSDGDGMATIGDGTGGAKFFGVQSPGQKFIFVVDNSLSMNKGRFETACMELFRTVSYFSSRQKFYVLFFSDTVYPLFYPEKVDDYAPASSANKYKLHQWLKGIHLVLRTDARKAVERALEMKPSAIDILTDGAFTDNTYAYLMNLQGNTIPIHTVGMEINQQIGAKLQAISKKHDGVYRLVHVPPQVEAASRKINRPRHRSKGPIWGIALRNQPPKKKK